MNIEDIRADLMGVLCDDPIWNHGDFIGDIEHVTDILQGESRHANLYLAVVRVEDEYFGYDWAIGKSGDTDTIVFPWDGTDDWTLFRLEPHEVTTVTYLKV